MAYFHQSIKNLRESLRELRTQGHIDYRDSYAANHLVDVIELIVLNHATKQELEQAIDDLGKALDLAVKQRP